MGNQASTPSIEEKLPFNEFDDDQDEIELTVSLKEDEIAEEQLSSKAPKYYQNSTLESQYSPRDLVTEKEESFFGQFHIQMKCRRPVFGKFQNEQTVDEVPACLVIFTAAFASKMTSRKFQYAKVVVSFEDGVLAGLDLDDDANDEVVAAAMPYQPRVLAFEPEQWWGPVEVQEGEITYEANLTPNSQVSNQGVGLSLRYSQPTLMKERSEIQGLETSSKICWSLKQNFVTNSGVVPQFSMPIIVQYTPGRPFVARVQISAKAPWRPGKIVTGDLDDPLRFDPERLGANKGDTDLSMDLKPLCKLDRYAGGFSETV